MPPGGSAGTHWTRPPEPVPPSAPSTGLFAASERPRGRARAEPGAENWPSRDSSSPSGDDSRWSSGARASPPHDSREKQGGVLGCRSRGRQPHIDGKRERHQTARAGLHGDRPLHSGTRANGCGCWQQQQPQQTTGRQVSGHQPGRLRPEPRKDDAIRRQPDQRNAQGEFDGSVSAERQRSARPGRNSQCQKPQAPSITPAHCT